MGACERCLPNMWEKKDRSTKDTDTHHMPRTRHRPTGPVLARASQSSRTCLQTHCPGTWLSGWRQPAAARPCGPWCPDAKEDESLSSFSKPSMLVPPHRAGGTGLQQPCSLHTWPLPGTGPTVHRGFKE